MPRRSLAILRGHGAALALSTCALLAPGVVSVEAAECPDCVRVVGTGFEDADGPLRFAGTNAYYLMVYAAQGNAPSLRDAVDEVLEEAAARGVSVIRTWAFNDGAGWNALQTAPGVYDEDVFRGLDYVLDRASALGLRVILPLVNNWVDYGGMDQYVAWSATANFHDDFYADTHTRQWYRDHAAAVVDRVNSFNGRVYRDDPTIFAWELGNEPRCASDDTGDTLVAWVEEMSAHLKSLDPNHLVSAGIEGFYDDPPGPWYENGSQGVDFLRIHEVATVDFASSHLWPDGWGLDLDETLDLLGRWTTDAADVIGKPFVLGEFGKLRDDGRFRSTRNRYDPATYFSPGGSVVDVPGATPVARSEALRTGPPVAEASRGGVRAGTTARDGYYQAIYELLEGACAGGSAFWASYHDAYPDHDGFGVYDPADASTLGLLEAHVAQLAQTDCLCRDADGDGFGRPGSPVCREGSALDCDDENPMVNPGMAEIPSNGFDDDCDPSTPAGCGSEELLAR